MKYLLLTIVTLLLAISLSYGDQAAAKDHVVLQRPIVKTEHLRAYQALTKDGKPVIYVTNIGEDGRRMGGEIAATVARVSTPLKSHVVTIKGLRPAAQPRVIVSRGNVVRNSQPARISGGQPVCFWKGQVVSPVRMGDRLVCPSENAPFASGNH